MTTSTQPFTVTMVQLRGVEVQLFKGGSGEPLLVLHDEMGHPGWRRFHEALARRRTLYLPLAPGYGKSEQLDWVMTMRDMASWFLGALDELKLGPVDTLAFSIGGWLAAEMAAMDPHMFRKLVLVAPAGIKPPKGEILDIFPLGATEYLAKSVLDPAATPEFKQVCPDQPSVEQNEEWAVAREQSCRLSWKPYMHDPALPHLLSRLKGLPTLVVWGRQDPIIPVSAGEAYHRAIAGAKLVVLEGCGHRPELEKTAEFVSAVQGFLSGK